MAFKIHGHNGFIDGLGQKVRQVSKAVGVAKGIYDTGKTIYTIGQTLAPVIGAML